MSELADFYAPGVTFPEPYQSDVAHLLAQVPADGTLHVAVLRQPYFDLLADGTKTVESRFNTKRAAPYGRVATGDLVLLKLPGEPITNFFFAADAKYVDLSVTPLAEVRNNYASSICAESEDAFWESKAASRYCSLITVGERGSVQPFPMIKHDQRGWVSFERTLVQ